MKLECSIEKIKEMIEKAERITAKNSTLPILNSILLIAKGKSLKLRATNLSLGVEIDIPAKVEREGVIAVEGNVLSSVFSNIYQAERVSLELDQKKLSVSVPNSSLLVKGQSHEDFPTIPQVSGKRFVIPAKKLIEGIKSVYFSAATSDVKPEVSSVYIYPEPEEDYLVFTSTDSFRLAEKKVIVKKVKDFPGVLIPFKNIIEILRLFGDPSLGDITVVVGKNQISFSSDDLYLTSRLIDGMFPDYKQIIPDGCETETSTLKADLLNALKLSNIFTDKFNQITLIVEPKKKVFEISAKNTDVGENKTKIDAAISGDPVEVSFNLKYLTDCFQSIYKDSISLCFNGESKPIVVRGTGDASFTYLIMPMNR